ncbi:hypothetical protein [Microcoleus sp. herbarium14]|uniref:hypothetical protein n=1 Tax=Microcoleus sp. herbarium14 TaxID=3055439 RepID=UPI002FD4D0C4
MGECGAISRLRGDDFDRDFGRSAFNSKRLRGTIILARFAIVGAIGRRLVTGAVLPSPTHQCRENSV